MSHPAFQLGTLHSVKTTYRVVAIDGPAASGKSSVARELARRLGFVYVNSGAMYRAVTWYILQNGIDPDDPAAVGSAVEKASIDCEVTDKEPRIRIGGIDPTAFLWTGPINEGVSLVSRVPRVRQVLVAKLRRHVLNHDLVMEGRDIGSVVFPETPYKFYIDASPDVRSSRRRAQGQRDQIAARDRTDSSRSHSPLVVAKDAHVIDSSHLKIEDVVREIMDQLKKKGLKELV